MTRLKLIGTFAALCACPSLAVAKPSACLTPAEAGAMMDFALPEFLDSLTDKCSAQLPKTSFLATRGKEMAATYRMAAEPHWPAAKSALTKLSDDDEGSKLVAAMPDASVKTFLATAMGVALAQEVNVSDCGRINDIAAALAPLPPQNLSSLIVNIVIMAGEDKSSSLRICR